MMPGRKRILLYVQHLTGSGHFVRTFELARALATQHDVWLLDGGHPVPRPPVEQPFNFVTLPRIHRRNGELAAWNDAKPIDEVMQERRRLLQIAVQQISPDLLVVEHFPFSKWNLQSEILSTIEFARARNSQLRVMCSLRDVAPPTRFDPSSIRFQADVKAALASNFHGLLVHADPRMFQLTDYYSWADQIAVPIHYTGFISEKLTSPLGPNIDQTGPIIVSSGGTAGENLRSCAIEAWRLLSQRGATGGRKLVVFKSLAESNAVEALLWGIDSPDVVFEDFSTSFLGWMSRADLSVSEAGYNTCANILETRTRAILIPNDKTSDQSLRAERLAERGLATVIPATELTSIRLADAMGQALASPPPQHDLDLDGAKNTLAFVNNL